jgi:hypothetical protein
MICFCCALSGCGSDPLERSEYGDYLYRVTNDSMRKHCITIMELSEQGKQKETIVFPTEINGVLVKAFGDEFGFRIEGKIESENLKNVYMHSQIERFVNDNSFNELKGYTLYSGFSEDMSRYFVFYDTVYLSKEDNTWLNKLESDHEVFEKVRYANVIYYYNYDNKTTFFVDDCDGTVVNVIPPNPYRKGYEFLGWYKEPECINKWDFDNDIVPSKEYDENGQYILKEIKLYAKWGN